MILFELSELTVVIALGLFLILFVIINPLFSSHNKNVSKSKKLNYETELEDETEDANDISEKYEINTKGSFKWFFKKTKYLSEEQAQLLLLQLHYKLLLSNFDTEELYKEIKPLIKHIEEEY